MVILYHQSLAQGLALGRNIIIVCSINDRLNGWTNGTGKNIQMLQGERVSVYIFATVISYFAISYYVKTQLLF